MLLSKFFKKHRKAIVSASRIVLFLGLLLLGFLFYRDNFLRAPVQSVSWYDGSFGYRQIVSIANDTSGELVNEGVLVSLDTETLIANGKMQSDCDDLRFIDSDNLTNLDYWIEGKCNSQDTQIWVEVPSLPSGGKDIYMYYGNGSVEGASLVWSGYANILFKDSCPSGWVYNSDLNGRFLLGSNSYNLEGGSNNHTHDNFSFDINGSILTTGFPAGSVLVPGNTHSHTVSGSVSEGSLIPEYVTLLACKNNSLDVPINGMILFEEELPIGWEDQSVFYEDRLIQISDTGGTLGGSNSHTHSSTVTGASSAVITGSVGINTYAGSGEDGSIVVSSNTNINTVNLISGRTCSDGGDAVNYSVTSLTSNTATLSSTVSNGCLIAGDEILLINLQGTSSNYGNVGKYELLTVENISGNIITFSSNKSNYYGNGISDDLNIGTARSNQRVMLQRVPNYTDVTVNNGISFYPSAWNGIKGGVLAFKASGDVVVSGTIHVNGLGYQGGDGGLIDRQIGGYTGESYNGVNLGHGGGLSVNATVAGGRSARESTASPSDNYPTGGGGGGGASGSNNGDEIGGSGGGGGYAGGGGGGGSGSWGLGTGAGAGGTGGTTGISGGGGGGAGVYARSGGNAGYPGVANTGAGGSAGSGANSGSGGGGAGQDFDRGGAGAGGGGLYGSSTLSTLYFGSGGGGGGGGRVGIGADGGSGGGIIFISANNISVSGSIKSNGGVGATSTYQGGGGGAGGSIKIIGNSIVLGSSLVTATGGSGTGTIGGDGGVGRVRIEWDNSLSGNTSPVASSTTFTSYAFTDSSHTHNYSSSSIQSETNIPPYLNLLLGKSTEESSVNSNSIIIVDSLPPLGWQRYVSLDNKFARISSASGSTGGESEHRHVVDILLSTPNSQAFTNGAGSVLVANENHTHVGSGYTNYVSNYPEYKTVLFVQKMDSQNVVLESEERPVPDTPIIGTGQALSTTSIRWAFTDNSDDELGFKIYDLEGNLKETCVGENLTYCDETGLNENTQYSRIVVAYNIYGNSDDSEVGNAITLISKPTIVYGGTKDNTSISLTVNNISSDTQWYFNCEDLDCNTGLNEWVTEGIDTATGLLGNTAYSFVVKAKGLANIETSYSDPVEIYTLADIPSLEITSAGINTLELTASNVANLAAGSSGIFFEKVGIVDQSGIGEWISTDSDVATGLSSNTEYAFQVKARNYDGTETAYSDSVSGITLSEIPSISASNITTTSIDLNWGNSVNLGSGNTAVLFECTGDNCNTGINEWNITNTDTVTGLLPNTEYTFKAKARNIDGVETDYSVDLIVRTLSEIPTISTGNITTNSVLLTGGNVNNLTLGNSGILFECTGESCNSGINDWINTTTDVVTDLISNTVYSFHVKGRNQAGVETAFSDPATILTLAKVPTLSISNTTTNSLSLTATDVNNLAVGSSGIMFECVDENCDTGIKQWMQTSTDSAIGLLSNTKYAFRAKSKNQLGIETVYSEEVEGTTLAKVPTFSASNITTTSITLNITNVTNIALEDSGVIVECTGSNCSAGINTWIQTTTDTVSELQPNTAYSFRVKARNQEGIETVYSNSITVTTQALPVVEEEEDVTETPNTGVIVNAPSNVTVKLVEDEEVDLTQTTDIEEGEQNVRISQIQTNEDDTESEVIVADLPVQITTDTSLDWRDAILDSSPNDNKTVVKLYENQGIKGAFTMYIVKGNTNALRICPEAKSLMEVSADCPQAVELIGAFPQSTTIEDSSVTVSHAVIGGIEYWIADGLTGTGAEGFIYSEDSDTSNDDTNPDNNIVERESYFSIWILVGINVILISSLILVLVFRRKRK
jgi:hypothetical protein